MVLNDKEILRRCGRDKMINPYCAHLIKKHIDERASENGRLRTKSVISYGLSSYGYDIRLGNTFKIFTDVNCTVVDPKDFDERAFVDIVDDEFVVIPSHSFALGISREYIKVPRDIIVLCIGKSTYARCGIIANVTPLEPEWEGHITLEISNTSPLPAKIYAGEGIVQLIFLQADDVCEMSYADRKGKYQKQEGIVLPRV